MAEIQKPTEKPEWASNNPTGIVSPSASKKESGWTGPPEKPPYQFFNWFQNLVFKWIDWLEEKASLTFGGKPITTLTITSGSITATSSQHVVDTEASAASDDLTNILAPDLADGRIIVINCASAARVISVINAATGVGQIFISSEDNFLLDNPNKFIAFVKDGSAWREYFRSSQNFQNEFSKTAFGFEPKIANLNLGSTAKPLDLFARNLKISGEIEGDLIPKLDLSDDIGTDSKSFDKIKSKSFDTGTSNTLMEIGKTNATQIDLGKSGANLNIASTINSGTQNFSGSLISSNSNPASVGKIRLTNTEKIAFRNSANNFDYELGLVADRLAVGANKLLREGDVSNDLHTSFTMSLSASVPPAAVQSTALKVFGLTDRKIRTKDDLNQVRILQAEGEPQANLTLANNAPSVPPSGFATLFYDSGTDSFFQKNSANVNKKLTNETSFTFQQYNYTSNPGAGASQSRVWSDSANGLMYHVKDNGVTHQLTNRDTYNSAEIVPRTDGVLGSTLIGQRAWVVYNISSLPANSNNYGPNLTLPAGIWHVQMRSFAQIQAIVYINLFIVNTSNTEITGSDSLNMSFSAQFATGGGLPTRVATGVYYFNSSSTFTIRPAVGASFASAGGAIDSILYATRIA